MSIVELPIFTHFDRQRFTQFGAMDCANWYGIQVQSGKRSQAMYPTMGRRHVNFLNSNKLVFDVTPRALFKTINYMYVAVGTRVYQIDAFYNSKLIGNVSLAGQLWFAYLPVQNLIYALLTDDTNIYIITEDGNNVSYDVCTDPNRPANPDYVAAFGNRFVVSDQDTPLSYITRINLGTQPLDPSKIFTRLDVNAPLFFSASGIVRQYAVLHNQLYIFNDFSADVWSNTPSFITTADVSVEFPWKLNTSYNFDYGMADPLSLAVGFGRMVWLAKNQDGLVSFMMSDSSAPVDISSQAVNLLLENEANSVDTITPFLSGSTDGFLYQYENTVFYRVSAGVYDPTSILDPITNANSIEFNFETKTWGRVIELNGSRCRVQKHVYFNNKHIVSVQLDNALYDMAGNLYYNELRTPNTDAQASNAFTKYPMRYELVTQQIYLDDYAEFKDEYVQIDFVFGNKTFYQSSAPFTNTTFVIIEESTDTNITYIVDEEGRFIVKEGTNTPTFDDNHYNALFKPHLELYYSDDGGVTFLTGDLREFSQLGQYRWLMRWYELGASRNRCYKLICVSSAPIVILGAVRETSRISGGAN